MAEDSEFIRHIECPNCGSSDANSLYTDGHTHCFSCGHHTKSSEEDAEEPRSRGQGSFFIQGDFAPLRKRRISESTCRKFGVRVDSTYVRFPYTDESGKIVAAKRRDASKDFRWEGKDPKRLFGQQLFGKGKRLVITEGEMDAMSVWEAFPSWPVVSIPNGAKAAKKSLAHQIKWCLNFEEIVLLFDNDEPGLEAAQECAALFPHDRLKLARMVGFKDPSEALQVKSADAIRQAIWNAEPYIPAEIVDGSTIYDLLRTPVKGKDADWPWDCMNDKTRGIRLKELVTLTAGSGCGKSTVCGEIAQSLVRQGAPIGYIGLEESIQRTGLRLMSVEANRPLHISNDLPEEDFRRAFDASLGTGRVFLREGFGSVDPERILNDIRFLTLAKGVEYVFLDHLSILLSGQAGDDERKMIDRTMTQLRSFVEETGIGLFLVCHLSRPPGEKAYEDGAKVSLRSLRGSQSIVHLSDMVLGLERDISSGEDILNLRVLKNRFDGVTGEAGKLAYSKKTGRLTDHFITEALNNDTDSSDGYDDY